jgi:hypothetical protein
MVLGVEEGIFDMTDMRRSGPVPVIFNQVYIPVERIE